MTAPELAEIADIADALEVSADTVRREMRAGRVPGAFKHGRSWVITVEAAERFIRDGGFERYGRKK